MGCSNTKSRIEGKRLPSLPKSNILSTPSAGHRDNCETMLVSGSQTPPTVLLTQAEIPDLLVSPRRNHPPPPPLEQAALPGVQSFSKLDGKASLSSPSSSSSWSLCTPKPEAAASQTGCTPRWEPQSKAWLTSTAQGLCMISPQHSIASPASEPFRKHWSSVMHHQNFQHQEERFSFGNKPFTQLFKLPIIVKGTAFCSRLQNSVVSEFRIMIQYHYLCSIL